MAAGDLLYLDLWTAEPLAAAGTLTSPPLSANGMDPESLLFKATSALGTADVKIEYQVAADGAGTFGTATAQDPLIASSNTEYTGALPEERHVILLPAVPCFRLLVTELSGTVADTLITATAVFRARQ